MRGSQPHAHEQPFFCWRHTCCWRHMQLLLGQTQRLLGWTWRLPGHTLRLPGQTLRLSGQTLRLPGQTQISPYLPLRTLGVGGIGEATKLFGTDLVLIWYRSGTDLVLIWY